jgi:hypothetical protein
VEIGRRLGCTTPPICGCWLVTATQRGPPPNSCRWTHRAGLGTPGTILPMPMPMRTPMPTRWRTRRMSMAGLRRPWATRSRGGGPHAHRDHVRPGGPAGQRGTAVRRRRQPNHVAVDARQHDVEHDRVVRIRPSHPQAVGAIKGNVDGQSLGLDPVAQSGGESFLVPTTSTRIGAPCPVSGQSSSPAEPEISRNARSASLNARGA